MHEMKDSGVEWIGEIPKDWYACKFKNICNLYTGNSIKDEEKHIYEDAENAHPYIATKDIDVVFCKADYENGLYVKNNDNSFKIAPKDSTLMCIEGGSAGRKKAKINQSVSFVNKLCCFYSETQNNSYINYFLNSPNYENEFKNNISGLIGGVSVSTLKNISLVIPPLDTQHRIADYLDRKCSKIDEIIEKESQVIEKLKAYKLSVITEAVTKGLNPDVPMKDSGIEWIGLVPSGWDVMKFGYCATIKSNLVPPDDYFDYPQISPDSIEKNSGRIISYKTVHEAGVISWNHLFYKGQIIYSKIRPMLNKVTIAPYDGLCSADMYPIETENNSKFIVYFMLSDYFTAQVGLVTENRVKMPKINQNELNSILVAIPPLEEQGKIVNYLDAKCTQIDSAIAKKQATIEKLTSYKKSLIYEVVTGKKEV